MADTSKPNTYPVIPKGMKLAEIVQGTPDENQLALLKELGVRYIEAWIPGEEVTFKDIVNLKKTVEKAGLALFSVDILEAYNSEKVVLNLTGRDEVIKVFQKFLKNIGRAGFHTTTYGFNTGSTYATGTFETHGCSTRLFDLAEAEKSPPVYGRTYSDEELWDNYAYFIKKVLPAAEDAGVRLALHPCDPPVTHRGVAQIFSSTESFRRAFDIAGLSPFSGISFCVGTWAEMYGPNGKGEDIIGAIREFGSQGRIFTVHFRNVSSPLPRFYETFVDNGYVDMHGVIKALHETGYDGTLVPDHVPGFDNEKRLGHMGASGNAYTIGYLRALLKRVETKG